MENNCNNISNYRKRLDKTLESPVLTDDVMLKTLVKNQILQTSHFQFEGIENVVEKRTKELSNFLGMLRSASVDGSGRSRSNEEQNTGWKIKQDSKEIRVMYREGPEGTPFHTLLAEGYVDGPLDVCMCISWESALYKKWWPQIAIPTFRVVSSKCLQRVRVGEQISLVRMKLSWPLSSREALVHYFAFEYFQDGLMVVLLNSISDSDTIDRISHGFTRDGIPEPEEVVRIDVVGVLSLFFHVVFVRTIANMDIKLDFVPPAFINFVSRQLIGSGFNLYKKAVASIVSKGDKEYREALEGPLYKQMRGSLYSTESKYVNKIEYSKEDNAEGHESLFDDRAKKKSVNFSTDDQITEDVTADDKETVNGTYNKITENYEPGIRENVAIISPKVKQALDTLEKAILLFHKNNISPVEDLGRKKI
ncbi:polyketide cyclase/dehydrase and lipid transportsuperfamily protein [Striga asiatica]|uniref:Polyketide cyclase/dehydrase and lipid transportsuperfamily protein n=1 Tax=Striga asiatica TaxID=4170 RepID=A0A5A7QK26_STRAF|nr:polyketide cyclase/dehydrase and lipid transportsuperfamily protein [Striga asiatica]